MQHITPVNRPPNFGDDEFALSVAERSSPTWLAIEEHYTKRLAALRAQNDAKGKDVIDTAFLRGQIAMVNELLKLGKDRPTSTN